MKDEDGRRREDRDRSSDAQSMPHIPPGTETEEERSLSERIKDWLLGTDDAKVAQEIERGNVSALQHLAVAVMILETATWLMLVVIRPATLNYRASIASFVWMIAVSARYSCTAPGTAKRMRPGAEVRARSLSRRPTRVRSACGSRLL